MLLDIQTKKCLRRNKMRFKEVEKRHAVKFDQLDSDLDKILKTVGVVMACGFIGCLLSVVFLLFFMT